MEYPIVVTYLLLAVTVLVSVKAFADDSIKRRFMFNAHDVVHYKKWYRCFTHGFLHGDQMHLFFNMFVLFMFGKYLESYFLFKYEAQGYLLFSLLYLMAILFSSIPALIKHKDNPGYNSLGASGAVSAIVFAFILINPNEELMLMFIPIPIKAYIFGPLYILFEYIMAKRGGTGIAHDAHLAGAAFGIVFLILLDYHYIIDFVSSIGS